MLLDTVYKRLLTIENKDLIDNQLIKEDFKKLIEDIKEALIKQGFKDTTRKQRYVYAKKTLEDKILNIRPVLKKTFLKDNMQVFTNSYIAFILENEDIINDLPNHEDIDYDTSPFNSIINVVKKASHDNDTKIDISFNDLMGLIKTAPNHMIDLGIKGVRFDKKYLEAITRVLGFKNEDTLTFYYKQGSIFKPYYIKNNNSSAVILPIKYEERGA